MSSADPNIIRKPFIEHIRELQLRLTWIVLVVAAYGFAAYLVHPQLMDLVQRPLGQTLYYTSPVGGFNFIFKICIVTGIVAALPFILYQVFSFSGPLLKKGSKKLIITYVSWAFVLAIAGVLFGYFVSLPAALHFLTTFGGDNIKSIIRADEYFNFALAYVAGFALIFQVPVITLFINRIKPLNPGRMMKLQRYIILFSFIVAAVLTPTPDPINQLIMALPMVFLYQVGIFLVWVINKKHTRTNKKQAKRLAYKSKPVGEPFIAAKAGLPKNPLPTISVNSFNHPKQPPKPYHARPVMDITPVGRHANYSRRAATAHVPRSYEALQLRNRPIAPRTKLIDMVVN